jgi:2-polyprenyl-3-methyl-5-hydroxy-6-metoxy-1,4-benzoquinol methylase
MAPLSLLDIVQRAPARPWAEGDNIPWHDPDFSERMLQEHLTQAHDRASRRLNTIELHVQWIHNHLLHAQPSTILDLGCGPGLYSHRLAALGHHCTGIDYSPASIRHAQEQALHAQLRCDFRLADIRAADYPKNCDLVMLIFGEWNIFTPAGAHQILSKAAAALAPGAILLLEPHPFATIQAMGQAGTTWFSSTAGLFGGTPHLVLMENS